MIGRIGAFAPAPASVLLPLALVTASFTPALCLAVLGRRRFRRRTGRRIARWAPDGRPGRPRGRRRAGSAVPLGRPRRFAERGLLPLAVGLLIAAWSPGAVGLAAGLLVGLGLWRGLPWLGSADRRRAAREQAVLLAQLPLTAELMAACLGSSASPPQAARAVARTIGGPMELRLAAVAAELALGAPPDACWARLGEDCPVLAPLAHCLVRTTVSGAPPAGPLTGVAVAQRAAASRAAHARVRRAGVLATAPLGLCFLPAFVLTGIVPVVIGLASAFTQRI
ncbi:type II secretion system F family protein [Kitasatospora sp. NPDC058965]|uniref:type II secretion system F family protein n=1 Tax=Kitasatospora sp. NPDC058965 TaxID=3346682 RepID=UPI0036C244E0